MTVSRSYHYAAGSGQEFKEEGFTIKPADFEEELTYDPESEHAVFPVIILMETDTPEGGRGTKLIVEVSLPFSLISLSLSLSLSLLHSS